MLDGLPVRQLAVVSLIRFSEPIAFTSLFPYMYFMIRDFHIAPTEQEISKFSGYLASSFAFFQFVFALQWGKTLNRIGRKPVLLCGLFGTSVSLLLFGFSTNYYMALFARSLAGALNGNIAVLRTVIGEICVERRHQAFGFSMLPLLFNVGAIIGPLVGGSSWFTRPDPHSPYEEGVKSVGSGYDGFVARHPYGMSNVVVAMFLWFSLTVGFFFLEETNDDFRGRRDYGVDMGDAFLRRLGILLPQRPWHKRPETAQPAQAPAHTTSQLESQTEELAALESSPLLGDDIDLGSDEETFSPYVSKPLASAIVRRYSQSSDHIAPAPAALTPRVISVITSNCVISLHNIAYNEFLPVFLAARFQRSGLHFPFQIHGGFGLDSNYIGTLMSSTGMMGILIVLVIFPWIDRSLGTVNGFRLSLSFFPVVYACVPMAIFTLHKYNLAFPPWMTPMVLYGCTTLKTLASSTGMPQVMILNHRAAAKQHRAYVNSLTMSMLALSRCVGPIIFGYIMTVGDNHGIGWLAWWLMALLALAGFVHSFSLQDYED